MKITVALASSFDEWACGYADAFADLGFTALCIGPCHVQFESDLDQTDALHSPWTAISYWFGERLNISPRSRFASRQA